MENATELTAQYPGSVWSTGRCQIASAAVVAACVTATGCTSPAALEPGVGVPAAMQVVDGEGQTGVAGEELPDAVVVRVLDASGTPIAGQIVNFRVTLGGGSVFAGAALTAGDGLARERWTLGTVAGPQRLEARAVDPATGAVHRSEGPGGR